MLSKKFTAHTLSVFVSESTSTSPSPFDIITAHLITTISYVRFDDALPSTRLLELIDWYSISLSVSFEGHPDLRHYSSIISWERDALQNERQGKAIRFNLVRQPTSRTQPATFILILLLNIRYCRRYSPLSHSSSHHNCKPHRRRSFSWEFTLIWLLSVSPKSHSSIDSNHIS